MELDFSIMEQAALAALRAIGDEVGL
ncbi:MAG: hypothetical protein RL334_806, partial [Chloroflexota bacterium]